LPGGTALAITGESELKASLVIDAVGKLTPFGPPITLGADLVDVLLLKDRVVIVQQMTTRKELKSYVAADGLVPTE
jgi:hypothetical protein